MVSPILIQLKEPLNHLWLVKIENYSFVKIDFSFHRNVKFTLIIFIDIVMGYDRAFLGIPFSENFTLDLMTLVIEDINFQSTIEKEKKVLRNDS
jgi:hypothetical protein